MLTQLAPANGEAILPLAECRRHLRVLDGAENDTIAELRDAAIDWAERETGHALSRRQFQLEQARFDLRLRLPRAPAVSVDAIAYLDRAGILTTLASTAWRYGAGFLEPAIGTRWPLASCREGAVRITFTAGYATKADVPTLLLSAAKVVLAALFADREEPDLAGAERIARRFRRRTL